MEKRAWFVRNEGSPCPACREEQEWTVACPARTQSAFGDTCLLCLSWPPVAFNSFFLTSRFGEHFHVWPPALGSPQPSVSASFQHPNNNPGYLRSITVAQIKRHIDGRHDLKVCCALETHTVMISLSWVWVDSGSDGQGSLACCSPWGHKESDTTKQLNWTEWAFSLTNSWWTQKTLWTISGGIVFHLLTKKKDSNTFWKANTKW